MDELKLSFKPEVTDRFQTYIRSDIYLKEQDLAEHWGKRQQGNIDAFNFEGNELTVKLWNTGLTDHYPQNFGYSASSRSIKQYIKKKVLNKLGYYSSPAYDPLHHFNRWWPTGRGRISIHDIIEEFGKIDDYGITKSCYFYNEIHEVMETSGISFNRVLEIGPGPGNLLRMVKNYHPKSRIIIVDLPTSLTYSFCHLLHRFPDATFCLPHEATSDMDLDAVDFLFLTNDQTGLIPENFIELAFNTMSFQEMKKGDISFYFQWLRKVMKKENLFYCVNAVEKPMVYGGKTVPIRFFEYPWSSKDQDYKYELSPVEQGRTYKPFYVRAVKIAVSHK